MKNSHSYTCAHCIHDSHPRPPARLPAVTSVVRDCQFPGTLEGRPTLFRVTSVAGHVFTTDFPAEYASWDSVEPGELFAVPVVKVPGDAGIVRHLQEEARGVDVLILWLDCDRVGALRGFVCQRCGHASCRTSARRRGVPSCAPAPVGVSHFTAPPAFSSCVCLCRGTSSSWLLPWFTDRRARTSASR